MFNLEGKLFHRLNQLNMIKPYYIKVGNKRYHYSEVELIFLSLRALNHFERSTEEFVIGDQYLQNHSFHISLDDFINCFSQFDSLFSSTTEILLTLENSSAFRIFANVLDNPFLSSQCSNVSSNLHQNFILSSKYISFLPKNVQERLNKFALIVNNQQFKINFDLFCCFSDTFFEMNLQNDVFICPIPDHHFECFNHLILIFEGHLFISQDYLFSSLMFLIDYFGLYSLLPVIPEGLLFPINLGNSIHFLSKSFCSDFPDQFQESLLDLVKHINQIAFEQFLQFHNFVLLSMFSSKVLIIPNEVFLFQLLIRMISTDPNRKILLKIIQLPFVSADFLINFIRDYFVDDLDSDFFENLKERLFCDIAKPNT
jgi:hypothetical protein